MNTKMIVKSFAVAIGVAIVLGLVIPTLVSAPNTISVASGFTLLIAIIGWATTYINKLIKEDRAASHGDLSEKN